jgi:hypothetical protein
VHNEKLVLLAKNNLNDQVKLYEMGRAFRMNSEMMNAYSILVGKPKGTRPTGRPRRRVDNIMNLKTDGVVWTGLIFAQDRDQWRALVNTVMNRLFHKIKNVRKFFSSCTTGGFSRMAYYLQGVMKL